jgi:hypothetical protein
MAVLRILRCLAITHNSQGDASPLNGPQNEKIRSLLDGRSFGWWNGTRINKEEVCGDFVLVVLTDLFFCDQVSFMWASMPGAISMASTGLFNLKYYSFGGLPPRSQGLGPCQVDVFPLPWFSLLLATWKLCCLVYIFMMI